MIDEYTTAQGIPRDSTNYYFQPRYKAEATYRKPAPYDLGASTDLRIAGEPALWNFYLGHPRYRLLHTTGHFSRSPMSSVILTLHRHDDRVWLTSTQIEYSSLHESRTSMRNPWEVDHSPTVIHRDPIELREKDWEAFEALLRKTEFWTTESPFDDEIYLDPPPTWTLEAHLEAGYKVVLRTGGEGGLDRVGQFLLLMTDIKVSMDLLPTIE